MNQMLRPAIVYAVDIPDAWYQCLNQILEEGYRFDVQQGSFAGTDYRIQFLMAVIHITNPYQEPYDLMTPKIPPALGIPDPVDLGYIEEYVPKLMEDHIEENEQYTYGSRIKRQMEAIIKLLRKTPHTNQAILQVAQPSDVKLDDPPCLRHIGLQVINGKLFCFPDFRSWDLWGGFPANLAGIAVLHKHISDSIEIPMGGMVATSKGLHIYGKAEEIARIRTYKDKDTSIAVDAVAFREFPGE